MSRTNRWPSAGIGGVLLIAAGLTAVGALLEAAPVRATLPDDPNRAYIAGVVVDEAGKPVGGATVRLLNGWSSGGRTATTAADGGFRLMSERSHLGWEPVMAEVDGGARIGFVEVQGAKKISSSLDVRIVVRQSRPLTVRVVDGQGRAVSEVAVAVLGRSLGTVARDATGRDGTARLRVPAGARVGQVVAAKPGVGLDYFENFQSWPPPIDSQPDPPAEVRLVLNGARTARVRTMDAVGKPVPGVELYPWTVQKAGKLSYVNLSGLPFGPALRLNTDAAGEAICDWLPADITEGVEFSGRNPAFYTKRGPEPILYDPYHPDAAATVRLHRIDAELTGRVTLPNGQPAAGKTVGAQSYGDGWDQAGGTARTAADGTYRIKLPPGFMYAVAVSDRDRAVPTRIGVEIRPGQPVEAVDFHLATGTLIQGRVTAGDPSQPVADHQVFVSEYDPATSGPNRPRIGNRGELTDADGRFSIRVGPGEYEIRAYLSTARPVDLHLDDQAQVTQDFHIEQLPRRSFSGVVFGPGGEPVALAAVMSGTLGSKRQTSHRTTTNRQGQFSFELTNLPMLLYAHNPAEDLAGTLRIGADERTVVFSLSPAAKAFGRVVDLAGRPRPAIRLQVSLIFIDGGELAQFTWFRMTDAGGKFSLGGVPNGATCLVTPTNGTSHKHLARVTVRGAQPVDLGDLKLADEP